MGARRYVNLEANLPGPQSTNFVDVSGIGSWHGSPHNISSYVARFPIMGPYVQVFVYNREAVKRKVSVWGYLVSWNLWRVSDNRDIVRNVDNDLQQMFLKYYARSARYSVFESCRKINEKLK